MTINQVVEFTKTMVFRNGGSFNAPELNNSLSLVNAELITELLRELIMSDMDENMLEEALNSSNSTLRVFKTLSENTVPADMNKILSVFIQHQAGSPETGRKAELISDRQFEMYKDSVIRPDLWAHPVCKISFANNVMVLETLPNAEFYRINYLRNPVAPFWDYCIDNSTGNEYHMPEGSYIALDHGYYKLYTAENVLMLGSVNHLSALTYPYTSLTKEIEYHVNDHPKFVYKLLVKMGVKLEDDFIAQYAMVESNKN